VLEQALVLNLALQQFLSWHEVVATPVELLVLGEVLLGLEVSEVFVGHALVHTPTFVGVEHQHFVQQVKHQVRSIRE